MLKCFFQV